MFGASVCTMFVLCSISGAESSITINYDDPLIADADGPYVALIDDPVIEFKGEATGGVPPYDWFWDFGDGENSTKQNPTNRYPAIVENYTVYLRVNDSENNSDWDKTTVEIRERRYNLYIEIRTRDGNLLCEPGKPVEFEVYITSEEIIVDKNGKPQNADLCKHYEFEVKVISESDPTDFYIVCHGEGSISPGHTDKFPPSSPNPYWPSAKKGLWKAEASLSAPWDQKQKDNVSSCPLWVTHIREINSMSDQESKGELIFLLNDL